MGVPHGQSGRVRKMSHTPGFGPRTVQPVASLYAIKSNWYRRKRFRRL